MEIYYKTSNAQMAFALGQMRQVYTKIDPMTCIIEIEKDKLVTVQQLVDFYKEHYEDKKKNKSKQQSANEKAAKSKSGVEVLEAAVDEGTEDRSSDKKATEQECELPPSKSVKRRRKLQKS